MSRLGPLVAMALMSGAFAPRDIDITEGEGDWVAPPQPKKKPDPVAKAPEKEWPETRQQRRARARAEMKGQPS